MRQPGEILRVQNSEMDRDQGKPLYEAIIARCREMNIAGATVFRGIEGYGETAEMHRAHLVHSDRPIIITIVDTAANIQRLVPVIADMMDTGLLATSPVEMIRIEKRSAPKQESPG